MKTVSITDYKLVTPTLAKVIVAWTGDMAKEEMNEILTERMSFLAQPVEDSFRRLTANTAVGFVRANREIRVLDNTKDKNGVVTARAQYRVMSRQNENILMDNKDKTLWEVKDGPGGQFLARHGNENLAELIEANTNYKRQDVPKLNAITMAKAAHGEFAAFCGSDGNMDYGFVTRVSASKCEVVSMATKTKVVVPMTQVASLNSIPIDASVNKVVARQMNSQESKTAADYWRTLYSYAPDYAEKLVHYTNTDAVL